MTKILLILSALLIIADLIVTYWLYKTAQNDCDALATEIEESHKALQDLNEYINRTVKHFDTIINAKIKTLEDEQKFQKDAQQSMYDEIEKRLQKLEKKHKVK